LPLALVTKSRVLVPKGNSGETVDRFYRFNLESSVVSTRGEFSLRNVKGMQVTASENHPGWADASPMSGDVGGNFSSERQFSNDWTTVSFAGSDVGAVIPGYGYKSRYTGPFLAVDPGSHLVQYPELTGIDDSVLRALGTKAIALVKPTNSVANLATALIELYHDGLPKIAGAALWKAKTAKARRKAAGGEYLNVEFGWKPLVNDILDVYKGLTTADAVFKQYERDAGKVVRRKFEFPTEKNYSRQLVSDNHRPSTCVGSDPLWKDEGNVFGKLFREDVYLRRTWFSGAFTYHLPGDWYQRGSSSKMDALLGTDITPEVLWNVTPWSWLADWFANTGDVISNLTDMAVDSLVMPYGYVMQHERATRTYTYVGDSPCKEGNLPQDLVLTIESKRRLRASPYGFGITWEGFSPRQYAILSALGISRGRKGK